MDHKGIASAVRAKHKSANADLAPKNVACPMCGGGMMSEGGMVTHGEENADPVNDGFLSEDTDEESFPKTELDNEEGAEARDIHKEDNNDRLKNIMEKVRRRQMGKK